MKIIMSNGGEPIKQIVQEFRIGRDWIVHSLHVDHLILSWRSTLLRHSF